MTPRWRNDVTAMKALLQSHESRAYRRQTRNGSSLCE